MKNYLKSLLPAAVFVFSVPAAHAAELVIEWVEPERYRDIEVASGSQRRFQERVMEELGGEFERAAQRQLPAGYTLRITVTDVDLAGNVEYFFGRFNQGIRVVRDLYFPRLTFSYELLDENGEPLRNGEVMAQDRAFYYSSLYISQLHRDDPFYYERRLIDKWFDDTFGDMARVE